MLEKETEYTDIRELNLPQILQAIKSKRNEVLTIPRYRQIIDDVLVPLLNVESMFKTLESFLPRALELNFYSLYQQFKNFLKLLPDDDEKLLDATRIMLGLEDASRYIYLIVPLFFRKVTKDISYWSKIKSLI